MKVENQVCAQAQAKRLKELGITQVCMFYYFSLPAANEHKLYCCIENGIEDNVDATTKGSCYYGYPKLSKLNNPYAYSAFTVAELGVMLPEWLSQIVGAPDMLTVIPPNEGTEYNWCVAYIPLGNSIQDECRHYCDGTTEAEARAAMLIYLLENNLTTAEEVNQRLQTA